MRITMTESEDFEEIIYDIIEESIFIEEVIDVVVEIHIEVSLIYFSWYLEQSYNYYKFFWRL